MAPDTRGGPLGSVSDTALWVAAIRALESERTGALFHDPLARELAAPRGFDILSRMPHREHVSWAVAVRTRVLDELVLEAVRDGADLILNLAAGLDTRPYRLELPAGLLWVEADMPGVIARKEGVLGGRRPNCRLNRISIDLSGASGRREWLREAVAGSRRGLVLTEGFLVYLEPAGVESLARDLAEVSELWAWALDCASWETVRRTRQVWGDQLNAGSAPMRFGVDDPSWFGPLGWRTARVRPLVEESLRLRRERWRRWLGQAGWALMTEEKRTAMRAMNGFLLLERSG